MHYKSLFLCIVITSNFASAEGLDCDTLADWSAPIGKNNLTVNQHHVFCGESSRKGSAKGFHATADGEYPSSYVRSTNAGVVNDAGIYTLRNVKLQFHGKEYTKSFSSMFPKQCSVSQINQSIVYSRMNSTSSCAGTGWAQCGPNAPIDDTTGKYCMVNGEYYEIASAVLTQDPSKINTGFPIYTP